MYAFVIMSNHLHVIVNTENNNLSAVIRDFKRFTVTTILKAIKENKQSQLSYMKSSYS